MKGKAYLGSQLHSILPSSFLPSARVTSLPTKQIKLLEACHDRYTTAEMEHNQKKILKQVEYESARRKRHINEKTRNRDEEGSTSFLCTFTSGNSRELDLF